MAAIRINSLDSIIEKITHEIESCQDGDEPMTMSCISERVNIDRKTLRKWHKLGFIRSAMGKKYSVNWTDGKLAVTSETNGIYQMTLSELLDDLLLFKANLSNNSPT